MKTPSHTSRPPVVVACRSNQPDVVRGARDLAARLGLELRECGAESVCCGFAGKKHIATTADELRLWAFEDDLALEDASDPRLSPLRVDFLLGATGHRRRSAFSRRQPLARAVGLRGEPVRVLDATAGLGRDTFLLACLGCQVVALERSRVLAEMLKRALDRARISPEGKVQGTAARIALIAGDAREYLRSCRAEERPEVVYIDPMYPARRKSAAGAGELRILRRLVGEDEDAGLLLEAARSTALRRVVVKRPRRAPPLAEGVDIVYEGRSVRYDAYLARAEDGTVTPRRRE